METAAQQSPQGELVLLNPQPGCTGLDDEDSGFQRSRGHGAETFVMVSGWTRYQRHRTQLFGKYVPHPKLTSLKRHFWSADHAVLYKKSRGEDRKRQKRESCRAQFALGCSQQLPAPLQPAGGSQPRRDFEERKREMRTGQSYQKRDLLRSKTARP